MKKSFLFSLAICLNGIMTGCMTGGGELRTYCYYKWINESNHTLTLTAENEPELFESVVLAPGESIEKEVEGNLDIRNPYQYLYDLGGITLLVDDGADCQLSQRKRQSAHGEGLQPDLDKGRTPKRRDPDYGR